MFTLTPAAARQIQQAASGSDTQNLALRIAARVDADGTVAYGMGFDDPKDDDMKLELEGVAVLIADEYQDLLNDIVLDFVELEPGEFNFIFADGGLMGSDTNFAAAQSAAPCGRAAGSANLGSDPKNPGGCGGGSCGGGGCGTPGRTH
jgi:iron-sulfur cluster assembly protein